MSTKMTERDWELEVVRACLPRRGAEGRDDRLFLEALHCFAVHDVTWRALPRAVRPLEQRVEAVFAAEPGGVFEAFFAMLAECNRTAGVVHDV